MQIQGYKWVHSKQKWDYDVSYREKGCDQINQNGFVPAQLYMDAKSLEHSVGYEKENLF
jgi:hypothetical protein